MAYTQLFSKAVAEKIRLKADSLKIYIFTLLYVEVFNHQVVRSARF